MFKLLNWYLSTVKQCHFVLPCPVHGVFRQIESPFYHHITMTPSSCSKAMWPWLTMTVGKVRGGALWQGEGMTSCWPVMMNGCWWQCHLITGNTPENNMYPRPVLREKASQRFARQNTLKFWYAKLIFPSDFHHWVLMKAWVPHSLVPLTGHSQLLYFLFSLCWTIFSSSISWKLFFIPSWICLLHKLFQLF